MKRIWILPVFILMIFPLNCCEEGYNFYPISPDQKVYFQYEYINFAWGYQHAGWLIDSSGNIYCFNKPENWHFEDSSGQLSAADMESNLLSADSVCFQISKVDLYEKIQLIDQASKAKISEPVHEMYDAGATVFYAFAYDKKNKTYKKIVLKQIGDFQVENSSRASRILYQWLKSITFEIHNLES